MRNILLKHRFINNIIVTCVINIQSIAIYIYESISYFRPIRLFYKITFLIYNY